MPSLTLSSLILSLLTALANAFPTDETVDGYQMIGGMIYRADNFQGKDIYVYAEEFRSRQVCWDYSTDKGSCDEDAIKNTSPGPNSPEKADCEVLAAYLKEKGYRCEPDSDILNLDQGGGYLVFFYHKTCAFGVSWTNDLGGESTVRKNYVYIGSFDMLEKIELAIEEGDERATAEGTWECDTYDKDAPLHWAVFNPNT